MIGSGSSWSHYDLCQPAGIWDDSPQLTLSFLYIGNSDHAMVEVTFRVGLDYIWGESSNKSLGFTVSLWLSCGNRLQEEKEVFAHSW